MSKLHYIAVGAALLSGCASQADTNSAVAALETTYMAAAAAALAYEALPNADPTVVAAIKRDEAAAFAALQPLVAAAQAGTSPAAAAITAAQAALTALQADVPSTPTPAPVAQPATATPAQGSAT
jgi:hypothetical protein